jgi:hypothetical protein
MSESNGINPILKQYACAAARFIEEHHPESREWEDLVGWCAWFISHGFMAAMHRDGKITAIAAVRPVNCAEDGHIPYKHATDGKCIFVDLFIVADHSSEEVFAAFASLCRITFGEREQIAFQRIAKHDYNAFLRNVHKCNKKKIGIPYVTAQPA